MSRQFSQYNPVGAASKPGLQDLYCLTKVHNEPQGRRHGYEIENNELSNDYIKHELSVNYSYCDMENPILSTEGFRRKWCGQQAYNNVEPRYRGPFGAGIHSKTKNTELVPSNALKLAQSASFVERSSEINAVPISKTSGLYSAAQSQQEAPRFISSSRRLRIIRRPKNMMVSGPQVTYGTHWKKQELHDIDFRVIGGALEDILIRPWTNLEAIEGRRIIRIERSQQGCTLQAHFRVIERPLKQTWREMSHVPEYLEVSCIRFDHADGITKKYFITSVDVIRIVEFLIDNDGLISALKLKERGRIRSNLAPLLFKNWSALRVMHLQFGKQILRYHSHNSYGMFRYLRLLLWENLVYALGKALLFYCVCIPGESKVHFSRNVRQSMKPGHLESFQNLIICCPEREN